MHLRTNFRLFSRDKGRTNGGKGDKYKKIDIICLKIYTRTNFRLSSRDKSSTNGGKGAGSAAPATLGLRAFFAGEKKNRKEDQKTVMSTMH